MRKALATDLPQLLELMAEFYAEAGYRLNRTHAKVAFATLLADERLGLVWLIEAPDRSSIAGYLVMTFCYSMEYGGRKACLDDLFVRIAYRNQGLSSAALLHVRTCCQQASVRAISVEVGLDNGAAQRVYRRTGFTEVANRQWLTLPLASATHDA